jgi:hypothetical protein
MILVVQLDNCTTKTGLFWSFPVMLQAKIHWIICLIAILSPIGWLTAGEPSAASQPPKTDSTATPDAKSVDPKAGPTIDKLIEQLDSAKYEERESAGEKLAEKGKEAIPALEKAAGKGDLEVSSRALGILGKSLKSSDDATSKAAEESLQRVAEGDNHSAARKARAILDKKNGVANNAPANPFAPGGIIIPGNGGFGGGRIIINGGMLQIGGGAAVKSLSVSNNNGVREIKATEGDKNIKIEDDPTNGIKIESTDKINGKEVTKKYSAKNVEDLKKNQPEGYKIFKEYGEQGNGGGVQLQLGQIQGPGALNPFGPNVMPAIPLQPAMPMPAVPGLVPPAAAPAAGGNIGLDIAEKRLKVMSAQLDALRKNESIKNASPEKKAELRKQMDELTQRVDELRKQLDGK